jgi:hypothetical protein
LIHTASGIRLAGTAWDASLSSTSISLVMLASVALWRGFRLAGGAAAVPPQATAVSAAAPEPGIPSSA